MNLLLTIGIVTIVMGAFLIYSGIKFQKERDKDLTEIHNLKTYLSTQKHEYELVNSFPMQNGKVQEYYNGLILRRDWYGDDGKVFRRLTIEQNPEQKRASIDDNKLETKTAVIAYLKKRIDELEKIE